MTTIVAKQGKKSVNYYKYGYEKDPITNQFKRVYLGRATLKEYLAHRERIKDRSIYCKECGKKKKEYADHSDYCKCQRKQDAGNVDLSQRMRQE